MDRVLQGTSATVTVTFTVDGVATDPSPATATVEVVRLDGTEVVAAGTATTRLSTGTFAYTLLPMDTEVRGDLAVRWMADLDGHEQTVETRVEIVTPDAQLARDRIAEVCEADAAPTLTELELWNLERAARRIDADGNVPTDVGWTATYDLNAAAAAGWRRKAGKVAAKYSFAIDNQRSEQSHIYDHCIRQAELFGRSDFGSVVIVSAMSSGF